LTPQKERAQQYICSLKSPEWVIGTEKNTRYFSVTTSFINKRTILEIKVAIFEDNKTLRDRLYMLIAGSPGFACTGCFANCKKVLKDIEASQPDVVLMDIEMPGISGIEAIHIIKKQFPAIQILMQTVFDDNDKIFASICAGASGYLLKKTPPLKILEAIKEAMEGGAPVTPTVALRVLQMFQKQSGPVPVEFINLSDRETEVLNHLVTGDSYKMIATNCNLSIDTVKSHIKHIYHKLHVNSKSEAVAKAIRQKLV
jgi:DNA-binding NarL/FixJ family response regulator